MVDRIACPWQINKFVDSETEFLYISAGLVKEVAEKVNAIPFDAEDMELNHHQEDGFEHISLTL